MGQLLLKRDFTRFVDDHDFPQSVEIHFGSKTLICSGMVLAQQSAILENMIREKKGVLMCKEIEYIGTLDHKIECIRYLYGANVQLDIYNIQTIITFSSLYGVTDLFALAFNWVLCNINIKNLFLFYELSKSLTPKHHTPLLAILDNYVAENVSEILTATKDRLSNGYYIEPTLFMSMLNYSLSSNGSLLVEWVLKSPDNKAYIFDHLEVIDIAKHFPDQDDFTSFIGCLSAGSTSVDAVRQLMNIQQNYFTKNNSINAMEKTVTHCRFPTVSSQENHSIAFDMVKIPGSIDCDQEPAHTISIASIPVYASRKDIEDVFSEYGTISEIQLFPISFERQLAFVSFAQLDSLQKVLSLATTFAILRNPISVKSYVQFPIATATNHLGMPEKRIFIYNVPQKSSKRDLNKTFSFFGAIVDVEIIRHKRCSFIEFESPQAVCVVLTVSVNGGVFKVLGSKVNVKQFRIGKK